MSQESPPQPKLSAEEQAEKLRALSRANLDRAQAAHESPTPQAAPEPEEEQEIISMRRRKGGAPKTVAAPLEEAPAEEPTVQESADDEPVGAAEKPESSYQYVLQDPTPAETKAAHKTTLASLIEQVQAIEQAAKASKPKNTKESLLTTTAVAKPFEVSAPPVGKLDVFKSKIELAADKVSPEYQKMKEEEEKHYKYYKYLLNKRSLFERITGKGRGSKGFKEEHFQQSKKMYDDARIAYGKSLMGSAEERLRAKGRTPEETKAILDRYSGIVRFNEIVKPGRELAYKMRNESRKENAIIVEKAYEGMQDLSKKAESKLADWFFNKKLFSKEPLDDAAARRWAANTMRAGRIVAFAGAGAIAAGIGPLGWTAAGIGFGRQVATGLASTFIGASAAAVVGKTYDKVSGASGKLAVARRGALESDKDLLKADEAYRHGSKEAMARKRAYIENASATIFGFGSRDIVSDVVSELPVFQSSAEHISRVTEGAAGAAPSADQESAAGSGASKAAENTPDKASGAEAAPATPLAEAKIAAAGKGMDSLFAELKNDLAERFADTPVADQPPVVRMLLDPNTHPNELSRQFNFAWGERIDGSESYTTQLGDAVAVTADGRLVLDTAAGEPIELVNAKGVQTYTYERPHAEAPVPPAASATAEVATPVTEPVSAASTAVEAAAPVTEPVAAPMIPSVPPVSAPAESAPAPRVPLASETAPAAAATAYNLSTLAETRAGTPASEPGAPSSGPEPLKVTYLEDLAPEQINSGTALPFETDKPLIRELLVSKAWSELGDDRSWEVFNSSYAAESPESAFRQQLFAVLRVSGVGPLPNEDVEQYLERADRALDAGTPGASENAAGLRIDAAPAVYESNGQLVTHGGSYEARIVLALEYLRTHPEVAAIAVEDPSGAGAYELTAERAMRGEYQAAPIPAPSPDTFTRKVF